MTEPFKWAYRNQGIAGFSYARLSIVIAIFMWFGLSIVFGMLFSPLAFLIQLVGVSQSNAIAAVGVVPAALVVSYAFLRARQQRQTHREVLELQEQGSPDAAAQALSHLDSAVDETRVAASYTIATAAESGPGKVIKASGHEPEEIVTKLAERLDDEEAKMQNNAATALRWFSEDYPEAVAPHEEEILAALNSRVSGTQAQAAIVLGNLGQHNADRADEYVEQLGTLVDDHDHEVRQATAVGLAQLPSQTATELLERLADDRNDEVKQTAKELLEIR